MVGFANVADSPLLQLADIPVFLDTGPEIISGSTRMGAGTVQKIALNMLSVLVGIGLGHVHDGYMVNVTADNAKLIDRAARIVTNVAGVSALSARAALKASGGSVKPAILIALGQAPDQARDALVQSEGHLAPHLTDNRH